MVEVTRRAVLLGTVTALAAPAIIARAEDPIRIGVTSPQTGAAAQSGQFMRNGINLALDAVNAKGGVLGRKMEVVVAGRPDHQSRRRARLQQARLRPGDMVAFIGSIRSTQVQAMAPDVLKQGKPMMIGGTDPRLTHQGNRWLFRCRPNDTYSAKTIAAYGVQTLGQKKIALIYSTDAFGTGGARRAHRRAEGARHRPGALARLHQPAGGLHPRGAGRSGPSGADLVTSYFTYETDLGVFAQQLRQLGVRTPWVGSPSIVDTSALEPRRPRAVSTPMASPTTRSMPARNPRRSPPPIRAGSRTCRTTRAPGPTTRSTSSAMAIGNAKSTEPEAIRTAILGIQGYKGAEGEYDFDQNGDGLHGYSVVQNQGGKIDFIKYVEFPKPS